VKARKIQIKKKKEILCSEELDVFSEKLEASPAALKSFMVGQEKSVAFLILLEFFSNFVTFGS
jgi:hypothetical protein